MRKAIILTVLSLAVISWVPLALVAHRRATTSEKPRIHLIPDMDNQERYKAQQLNPLFADLRAMRPQIEGTVAQGQLYDDSHLYFGKINDDWATGFPMEITEATMKRGQQQYNIYCAPCHGASGDGNGMVSVRAEELREGTWVPPTSLHSDTVRQRPVGHLFNTITNGIRNMPSYGKQIDVEDRWAVVAYVLALQRSQNAQLEDVPEELRPSLR